MKEKWKRIYPGLWIHSSKKWFKYRGKEYLCASIEEVAVVVDDSSRIQVIDKRRIKTHFSLGGASLGEALFGSIGFALGGSFGGVSVKGKVYEKEIPTCTYIGVRIVLEDSTVVDVPLLQREVDCTSHLYKVTLDKANSIVRQFS